MVDRARIFKLVAVTLVICMVGTAVIVLLARILVGSVLKEPDTVEVQVRAPEQVVVNEPFAVTLQINNLITVTQTLHSIDIEDDYLEGIRLEQSTPAYSAMNALPLTNFTSLAFGQEIPVNTNGIQVAVIELQFVAEEIGTFAGIMDVCLADGTLCLSLPLETAVTEN